MVKSMTGYGKASAVAGTKTITVEVRSLNGKQLDLGVKMPAVYRSSEYELRSMVAAKVSRGKTDVHVNVENSSPSGSSRVDPEVFGAYYRQIAEAASAVGIAMGTGERIVPAILHLPDVMVSGSGEVSVEESAALLRAATEALEAFDGFRTQEGAVLLADMLARVSTIEELLARVEPFEKARVPAVRARILENVAAVGVTVDANRLEQEIVFWVEKLDITEEKVRLTKHCAYFRETAGENEAGRKLGFIAQEMGREINTLGSKAGDANIQMLVVQMKDELEKIKEQLLNIL